MGIFIKLKLVLINSLVYKKIVDNRGILNRILLLLFFDGLRLYYVLIFIKAVFHLKKICYS
jgi:hypothetical protein